MTIRTALVTTGLIAVSLVSGAANAALQGRDLDGNLATFEAYYDTVLDITWLADANYGAGSIYDDLPYYDGGTTTDGLMTWAAATTWAANLSFYNPSTNQTYADWRLPNVGPVNGTSFNYDYSNTGSTDWGFNITSPQSEMAHLYYVTLGNSGYLTPAGAYSSCYAGDHTCLDNVGPFANLQTYHYWSSTEFAPNSSYAWDLNFDEGYQAAPPKRAGAYALAVSPGDVAAVPEAETYALMLAGLGLIGWRVRRRG